MAGSSGSKTGRNEARKLAANAYNNVGVALVLAALLQPPLAFLQQDRTPTLAVVVASVIFFAVGFGMFSLARRKARELED